MSEAEVPHQAMPPDLVPKPGDNLMAPLYYSEQQRHNVQPGGAQFRGGVAAPGAPPMTKQGFAVTDIANIIPGNADLQHTWGPLYANTPVISAKPQTATMPAGANFYMPPGPGMAYMDPYGIMNPGALPPLTPPPSKAAKKKKWSCC